MKKTFKPTLFLILGTIIVIIGIPYGIYGLTLSGGASLGGVLILAIVFVAILVIVVDRIIVQKVTSKRLNIAELILLISCIIIYQFNDREIVIDVEDQKIDYFVLIENNGNFKNSELRYKFPFSKLLIVEDNKGVVSSISKNYRRLNFISPRSWDSQSMQPDEINNIRVQFYSDSDRNFTEEEKHQLILDEIKTNG